MVEAKRQLVGAVAIDLLPGPSEVMVLADETADAEFLAADLLAQGEHGPDSVVVFVTTSETLLEQVEAEVERQAALLSRGAIIREVLDKHAYGFLVSSVQEGVDLVNAFAPEHLEVMMENPMEYIGKLDNAGSVFLGNYAPEPLGDYYAGPNHVLPTSGTARFFSPLSVDAFIKKSSYIYYTDEALRQAHDDIVLLANKEGLTAHANSIIVRYQNEK